MAMVGDMTTWTEAKQEALNNAEKEYWTALYIECNGNISAMSRSSDVVRSIVRRFLEKHQIRLVHIQPPKIAKADVDAGEASILAPRLWTVQEAAAMLEMSPAVVNSLCVRGVLRAEKHGRKWMVHPTNIRAVFKARRVKRREMRARRIATMGPPLPMPIRIDP